MLLCIVLVCLLGTSCGYDIGHHVDLTVNTLQLFGYNQNAQQVAGAANFFIDYFTSTILPEEYLPELNTLHFDNVFTLQNMSNYWAQFVINAKRAVQTAASSGDVVDYLMTVGGTLHTVQDFYAHSSWVDLHFRTECDCYRPDTWIAKLHSVNGSLSTIIKDLSSIHTYSLGNCDEFNRNCFAGQIPHGDACGGINKDSYVRPYWEQSYGFAFSASMEWVDNMQQWASEINAAIVEKAKAYTPSSQDLADLNKLTKLLNTVSYAVKFIGTDGGWKGPGSGSLLRFIPAEVEFVASTSIYKSRFLDSKIHLRWTLPNVYDAPQVSGDLDITTIPQNTKPYQGIERFTPVIVRTTSVSGGEEIVPSYFAVITIDGMEFVEAVRINDRDFEPHWTSIKFVDAVSGSVPILYTLKDNRYPLPDEAVSISPSGNASLSFSFDITSHVLSGDINGVYDNSTNVFQASNFNETVAVSLFVTGNRIANCDTGLPAQYCPNEAYVMTGVFDQCSGPTVPNVATRNGLSGFLFLVNAVFASVFKFVL